MTPSLDHTNGTPPSAGGWHNLGLLTASLAVVLVVAGTVNLTRHSTLGARTPVDPKNIPVNVQLSSAITPTTDTGSGDPSGAVEPSPQFNQTQSSPTIELNAAPLPEVPSLSTLPDVPAPKPDARPQSPRGTAPPTPVQNQASTSTNNGANVPAVQQLQFGLGAGRQPAPNYPSRALSRGHEGTVVVQFTIAESGEIEQARAVTPSRYPELNAAAISTIRQRWKFPAGAQRIYQISITFKIR